MYSVPFPAWMENWLGILVPAGQVALIALTAWILQRLLRRLIHRVGKRSSLPPELIVGTRRVCGFLVYTTGLLLILERLGVSGTTLLTGFMSFAAVAAVAFFAAWSVLSNIFCTILIIVSRPFRLYDHIELVDSGDKPGLRGQVIDINLIYTTLQEPGDRDTASLLQVPNSLFFQRTVRRWRGTAVPSAWIVSSVAEDRKPPEAPTA